MGRVADTSNYSREEVALWERIKANENQIFHTVRGLAFRIEIRGNELFVDRRSKSITRSSVNMAYKKWTENKNCGPKNLGVFGASYLWGMFREMEKAESKSYTENLVVDTVSG